ncbi:hypothetical protein M408DRAFT_11978 [Serendipita vermifera MAFF 305830]|uniref:Uncharacterized protein n=1 Tax=Serendipita vermifera MAFF 305830 TaxID=933852 RepID=A0A0C3AR90_SERVB|nr:hypothetical protein M408DRAFT_11978 [Serendipita vermifera MAFF 305830]
MASPASPVEYQSWLTATSIISVMGFAASVTGSVSTALGGQVFGEKVSIEEAPRERPLQEPRQTGIPLSELPLPPIPLEIELLPYRNRKKPSEAWTWRGWPHKLWNKLIGSGYSATENLRRVSGWFVRAGIAFAAAAALSLALQLALTDKRVVEAMGQNGDVYKVFRAGSYMATLSVIIGFVLLGVGFRRLHLISGLVMAGWNVGEMINRRCGDRAAVDRPKSRLSRNSVDGAATAESIDPHRLCLLW